MGAATAVSAGAGALGAVTGAITMLSEGKNKKKIAREIANQKEVPVTNIGDGMQVSTLGADLKKEQQSQLAATQVGALQDGGTRALLGGLGRVTAASQNTNTEIAANLDEQQTRINDIKSQDEGRIQSVKEQRANAKLAALSSQYNASSQNASQALGTVVQGASMAGSAFSNSKKNIYDPQTGKKIE